MNPGIRKGRLERWYDRKRMDDISKGAHFDDKYLHPRQSQWTARSRKKPLNGADESILAVDLQINAENPNGALHPGSI